MKERKGGSVTATEHQRTLGKETESTASTADGLCYGLLNSYIRYAVNVCFGQLGFIIYVVYYRNGDINSLNAVEQQFTDLVIK